MNQLPDTEQFPQVDISSTFGLHPDMTVEVLTMENRLTFVGKVETVRNGAVVLREAKGDSLPPVMYNREIKLRYFQGERGSVALHLYDGERVPLSLGYFCFPESLKLHIRALHEKEPIFLEKWPKLVEGKACRLNGIFLREECW